MVGSAFAPSSVAFPCPLPVHSVVLMTPAVPNAKLSVSAPPVWQSEHFIAGPPHSSAVALYPWHFTFAHVADVYVDGAVYVPATNVTAAPAFSVSQPMLIAPFVWLDPRIDFPSADTYPLWHVAQSVDAPACFAWLFAVAVSWVPAPP